MARVASDWKSE